jgi:hypothetical protein
MLRFDLCIWPIGLATLRSMVDTRPVNFVHFELNDSIEHTPSRAYRGSIGSLCSAL